MSAHSASTVGAGEKSSIRTNRKLTTRFLTSHILCTLPLRPQRVAQNAILRFSDKIQLLSKEVCYKSVKNSSGKVVAA